MPPKADAVRQLRCVLGLAAVYGGIGLLASVALWWRESAPQSIHWILMISHGGTALLAVVSIAGLRRVSRLPTWMPRMALLICVLLGIVSLDLFATAWHPEIGFRSGIVQLHPERGWAHIPDATGHLVVPVKIDSHGFRVGMNHTPRDEADGTRILFLGDSVTFGFPLSAGDAFCNSVVEQLNARHAGLDVIAMNAGVTGYDAGQQHHLLVNEGLKQHAALIVYQFCLNDITHQFDPGAAADPLRHPEFGQVDTFGARSGLYRLAMRVGARLRESRRQARAVEAEHFAFTELLAGQPSPRVTAAWERATADVNAIIETSRDAGVPLLMVCFPILRQLADPTESDDPQVRLAAIAKKQGVRFLDLLPVFREDRRAPMALFIDQTHPTVAGHRLAGKAIADAIEQFELIEAGSPD